MIKKLAIITTWLLTAMLQTQAQFVSTVDPTFNPFDTGEEAIGSTNLASFVPTAVSAIAVQANSSLLVGVGAHYNQNLARGLARITPNGGWDATLTVPPNIQERLVNSIAIQPDGKIVTAGRIDFTFASGLAPANLQRMNADGSFDESFSQSEHDLSGSIKKVIVLGDGKIIVVGSFTNFAGVVKGRIVRINANGTVDETFNTAGTGANSSIEDVVILPDNKLLIAGNFTSYNATGTPVNRIARLNADGTLDDTFNPSVGANGTVHSLALLPDGKLLVAGNFTSIAGVAATRLARLEANGNMDNTWPLTTGANASIYKVLPLADGSLVVAGQFTTYNGVARSSHVRLTSQGQVVPDYTTEPNGTTSGSITDMVEQPGQKILLTGTFQFLHRVNFGGIARIENNGKIDPSFNPNGGAGSYLNRYITSMERLADGRIMIGGLFSKYNGVPCYNIMRLTANGLPDPSFEPGDEGPVSQVVALAVQPDNKTIIAGGFARVDGVTVDGFARLLENGRLDPSFIPVDILPSTTASGINCIKVLPNQQILVGGEFQRFGPNINLRCIARLNADGSVDATFNPPIIEAGRIGAILPLADGKLLVGGASIRLAGETNNRLLFRLNADGSLDNTFNAGGAGVGGDGIRGIAPAANNQYLVWGSFFNYNGISLRGIVKINADGTPVLPNTYPALPASLPYVRNVHELPNGKLILTGFTVFSHNNIIWRGVVRLNADGSVDNTFRVGNGAQFAPGSISGDYNTIEQSILMGNTMLVAGTFTLFNDVRKNRITSILLGDVVTPVTWLSFTVKKANGVGLLQWSTASENNNRGFIIQRSADGQNFTSIGFVAANGDGDNAMPSHYGYTDAHPLVGKAYYRIQQVDKDGKNSYSTVRSLQFAESRLAIYPNPVAGQMLVDLGGIVLQKNASLHMVDLQGRIVLRQNINQEKTTINVSLLPAGTYYVSVYNGNEIWKEKVTKW